MEKNIKYYMSLAYTRELIPEPEGGWFVRIKELPGCMSQGDTADEAMTMIEDALRGWLEAELRNGSVIPEPRPEEDFSGKFVVRVPKSLHRKINDAADDEGVSLNQWIITALAESIGESVTHKATKKDDAKEEAWPGLSSAMKSVLADVGMGIEAQAVDERLFAGWLDENFEGIHSDTQRDRYEEALEKTRAFSSLLLEHQQHSPVLQSMCKFLDEITHFLELDIDRKHKLVQVEILQDQISEILSTVNNPINIWKECFESSGSTRAAIQSEPVSPEFAALSSEW